MRTMRFLLREGLAGAIVEALTILRPRMPQAPSGTVSKRKHPRHPSYRSDRSIEKRLAREKALANHRRIEREGVPAKYLHSAARRRLEAV